MTTERQTRMIRLGNAVALTRGGPDGGLEFNLTPGWVGTPLAIRVASSRPSPAYSGKTRRTR
jgi:hypothetical protein